MTTDRNTNKQTNKQTSKQTRGNKQANRYTSDKKEKKRLMMWYSGGESFLVRLSNKHAPCVIRFRKSQSTVYQTSVNIFGKLKKMLFLHG